MTFFIVGFMFVYGIYGWYKVIFLYFLFCLQDTVGFIGLGNMGCHMANNLMKKGHSLVVYDITKEAVDNAVKSGK